jgi:PPOX class probable F420-dependent enzyme
MDLDEARAFLVEHHRAILATARADGRPQMSPISVALDSEGRPSISTRETAFKLRNIRRNPLVSLCVFSDGLGSWIQIDGKAEVVPLPEAMDLLITQYRKVAGEHPDWDDFRRAMEEQRRVIVRIDMERAGPDRQG